MAAIRCGTLAPHCGARHSTSGPVDRGGGPLLGPVANQDARHVVVALVAAVSKSGPCRVVIGTAAVHGAAQESGSSTVTAVVDRIGTPPG